MITLADLTAAEARISGVLRPTPVDRSDSLSRLAGRPVLLKPEHQQRTGSFKIRGAYNRIAQLPAGVDVVAASAGNHAQGVALAASLTGRQATIFMPLGAALPKIEATKAYGAAVCLGGASVDDCILVAKARAEATGAVYVPPFDDLDVIAGQGTIGLELAVEAPEADVVVVPVGGGGLLAGVATALAHTRRSVRVIGVEAAGAPTLQMALKAGRPVTLDRVTTMADGIAVRACSPLTLSHAQAYVDEVVTVDEEEISQAMLLLVERAKAVVEPSGAASLAAILAGKVSGHGAAVALLSGGNLDPLLLTKLIEHGLSAAGRYLVLRVVMADRPGALAGLTAALARLDLNVLDVEHHRSGRALGLAEVEVQLTVETRDEAHHHEVIAALGAAGYRASPAGG
ncbi:MAG: threonine ammonia-lyase [Actinomycetota bacterium]|nr:threonine ammonia-lyase [Actinomycetota bacterium]